MSLLTTGIKAFFSGASPATWLAIALVAILALGAATWRGYEWGHHVAETEGRARYAELDAAQARANDLASQAALKLLERQMEQGNEISGQLASARKTIAAQGREIRRRIEDALRDVAAVDGPCSYGPGWLLFQNGAFGLGDCSGRGTGGSGGAADGPDSQTGAPVPGVRGTPAP